jgi:hypothetical protein
VVQVYPLIAAMSLVTGMCVFQLTRNVFLNPDVRSAPHPTVAALGAVCIFVLCWLTESLNANFRRISKSHRQSAVLENAEEGERYSQHAFRRYVSAHRPEVFPAINRFFSESGK